MTEEAVKETKTETIDDIASQFQVSTAPAEPKAAEPQPSQPVFQPKIDPLDENQMNQFAQQTNQTVAELKAKLQSIEGELNESRQTTREAQVEGEISKAVNVVKNELPNFVSDGMVRGELEHRYRTDKSFQIIWDNRSQNPAAFKKTLGLINQELRGKFSTDTSQEIIDNHKAAQESAQGRAQKQKEQSDNPIKAALDACKTEGERQKVWNRIKQTGRP